MPMCGGVGSASEATPEVQEICNKVKAEIESKTGKSLDEFKAVQHKTQVVAGTNFFVKIHVGNGDHIHARIYRDLQQNVSLHSIQADKKAEDELSYF